MLAIATAYKKEFFVTKCDEFPFDDGQWHSLAICQVKPVSKNICLDQKIWFLITIFLIVQKMSGEK